MKKSQVAVEYLVLVATALIIVTAVFYFFRSASSSFSNDIRVSQLQNTVNRMKDNADMVCILGKPAKVILSVEIPRGVIEANFKNHTIYYKLAINSHSTDIFATSLCNLTGNLPKSEGTHKVLIEALEKHVNISIY